MKSKKVILSALAVIVISAGSAGVLHHLNQPKLVMMPPHPVMFSPDLITHQEAVATIAQVEQEKDFSVFVYQCDLNRHIVALIEHPDTDPKLRVIYQANLHQGEPISVKYAYKPASDGWSFLDTSGTTWKVEAKTVKANDQGVYKGYRCKFDVLKSAQVEQASYNESPESLIQQAGA